MADAELIEMLKAENRALKERDEKRRARMEKLQMENEFLKGLKYLDHEIGEGGYGRVFRGAYRPSIMQVRA